MLEVLAEFETIFAEWESMTTFELQDQQQSKQLSYTEAANKILAALMGVVVGLAMGVLGI